jgi:hypothetical protein
MTHDEFCPMIKRPPISFVVLYASSDALDVFRRLPGLALIVLLIDVGGETLRLGLSPDEPTSKLILTALDAATTFLIIPFEIAVYRLMILGEVTSRYTVAASTSRFQRFLAWTALLWLISEIPSLVESLPSRSRGAADVLELGLIGIFVAVCLRLILLFPAIAVDSPAATAADALADSKGHFWYFGRAMLVVFVPLIVVTVSMLMLVENGLIHDISDLSLPSGLPRAVFTGLVEFATTTLSLVVTSRLFQWVGARVKGSAVSPSPSQFAN